MERVGDILERVCPCGGDPTGPQHQESLLHRRWMLGQGLANDHDPIAAPTYRNLRHVVPINDDYDLP